MRSPTYRYFLKKPSELNTKRSKPELVMAEISYGYKEADRHGKMRHRPMRYSLKQTIVPSKFGLEKNNYKFDVKTFEKSQRFNNSVKTAMGQFESLVTKAHNYFLAEKKTPSPKELKKYIALLDDDSDNEQNETTGLVAFLRKLIAEYKTEEHQASDDGKKDGTIKTYNTLLGLLESYDIATKRTLSIENLDENTFNDIWNTLNEIYKGKLDLANTKQKKKQRKNENGYAKSTIGKHQSTLFTVLKQAKEQGHNCLIDVSNRKHVLKRPPSQKQFTLTEEELQKIRNLDVSEDESLIIAKKYVLIAASTGLRIQSMLEAANKKTEIYQKGNIIFKYIHSYYEKTDTWCVVPLLKPALEVIENDTFPIFKTGVNEHIKRLFERAEITRMVTLERVGFKKKKEFISVPISSAVSSHDFRKTMYTNLNALGMSEEAIELITHPKKGGKSAMGEVYNKIKDTQKALLFVSQFNSLEDTSEFYTFE